MTAVDVGNGSKAIEGPMLAERFTGLGSANVWDAGKLEAMEGRQLAEQFRSEAGSRGRLGRRQARGDAGPPAGGGALVDRPHGGPLG